MLYFVTRPQIRLEQIGADHAVITTISDLPCLEVAANPLMCAYYPMLYIDTGLKSRRQDEWDRDDVVTGNRSEQY